jgi:hypothetical protein
MRLDEFVWTEGTHQKTIRPIQKKVLTLQLSCISLPLGSVSQTAWMTFVDKSE